MIKGIGIDIIEIDRINDAVKKLGPRFLNKIFTENEIKYCTYKNKLKISELAVRFAAKEAYSKAMGTGMVGISWSQIEILNNQNGKPYIKIRGKAKKNIHISLSHSASHAVASVLIS